MKINARTSLAGLVAAIVVLAAASNAPAINLLVYKNNDSGAGSLRQAIADNAALGGGNTIIISNVVTGTIALTSGELLIGNDVTITGPGANLLAVNGNGVSRVFHINNATVTISGLTIANGNAGLGGGIYNKNSTLTLSVCVLTRNWAIRGGGIYNDGENGSAMLTIVNSTLNGNSCFEPNGYGYGGGIYNDGGNGSATLRIIASTFSHNVADYLGNGDAIYNTGLNGNAMLTITASTLDDSSGANRYTIFNSGGTLQIGDSILKAGTSGANIQNDGGTVISQGYNLSSDNRGGYLTSLADQVDTDPMLGPLQDNGGPTPTMIPLPGSPAIDQGSNALALTNDQRGRPRIFDNPAIPNAPLGDGSDIGAMETDLAQVGANIVVNSIDDHDDGVAGVQDCTLREAINAANANAITFAPGVKGFILLKLGELTITHNLTITGPTASGVALNGKHSSRVFYVTSGTVSLSNLTIQDGFAEGYFPGLFGPGGDGNGGGLLNEATLTLTACTLTGNTAMGGQGGLSTISGLPAGAGGNGNGGGIFNQGTLHLINCTLSSNSAAGGAGGLVFDLSARGGNGGNGNGGALFNQGTLTLTHCTFSSNSVTGGSAGPGNPFGNNGSSNGGGLYNTQGSITISSSIIAGNSAAGIGPDVAGALTSSGYNLIGTTSGNSGIVNGVNQDQAGTSASPINALLGPLQDNGGPTPTMALLPGSPAIDQGRSFGLTTDQRGRIRPIDNPAVPNAVSGDGSDIGAMEMDPVQAGANIVVNTMDDHDDGVAGLQDCTLREAINAANTNADNNTITFAPELTGLIVLTLGELAITHNLTIQGPTASGVAVGGNHSSRVFHVTSGTVSLSNLTLRDGFAEGYFLGLFGPGGDGNGGGILNEATLTLTACTLAGNIAMGGLGGISTSSGVPAGAGGNGNGGGLYNQGTLHLINCTLSSNSAAGGVGGLVFDLSARGGNGGNGDGGALFNQGTLTVTHCTFSSNSVTGGSAGVGNPLGDNGSSNGGGLYNSQGSSTISSSIIAGNRTAVNGPDLSGMFTSGSYNLIGQSDGSSGFSNGVNQDQVGSIATPVNPLLGPLADNGGPTPTMALLSGSPAIDKGMSFGLATDQRGFGRPYDNGSIPNASGGDGSDIGAFEVQVASGPRLTVTRTATNTVAVSWPSPSTGFVLQHNTNGIATVYWSNAPGPIQDDSTTRTLIINPPPGNRYYRLFKP